MLSYLKALVGAAVAGLTALGTGLTPDPDGTVAVTPTEWVAVAIAFLAGLGLVYAVPNKAPATTGPRPVGPDQTLP